MANALSVLGINQEIFLLVVASGLLPALFWLWFWLREDTKRPEPKRLIFLSFLGGAIAVIAAYKIQYFFVGLPRLEDSRHLFVTMVWLALIEEMLKFLAVYFSALRSRYFDEPVDAMIYFISGALGFAAVENILFMLSSFMANQSMPVNFLLTGNFRFIGATIIHVTASATFGAFLGLAFYKKTWGRALAVILGLIAATGLHSFFNYLIIKSDGAQVLLVFTGLWFAALFVIWLFERVKKVVIKIKTEKFINKDE